MANTETTVAAVEVVEKADPVRVSCAIPAELYERLFNNDRYDKRKEKGEYLGFIIESYAKGLSTPPQV